ncbi:hypothetical protein [Nocardia sp. NPDC056000]|uniref:hypothetical protein n=1 Tax=Nocardia sp. NPDC056000 TaxID=3345674 RepID=UPI0035D904DC
MSGLRCGAAIVVAVCAFVLSGCSEDATQQLRFGESLTVSRINGTVGIAVLRIDRGSASDLEGLTSAFTNPLADPLAKSPAIDGTPYYVRYRLTRTSAGADVGTYFVVNAGRKSVGQMTISPAPFSGLTGFAEKSGVEKLCAGVGQDEFRALSQGQSLEGCTPFLVPSSFGPEAPTRVQWVPYKGNVVATWSSRT